MKISKWLLTYAFLAACLTANASGIEGWSSTAASNNGAAPNGWPTGMNPSDVKLTGRQMMAATRSWYEDAQWIDFGFTPTWLSTSSFKVSATTPSVYHVNRRVRTLDGVGYNYGTISAVTYGSGNATVTVTPDSGTISNTLSRVWVGAVGAISSSLTSSSLGISAGDAITSNTTSVSANGVAGTVSVTTPGGGFSEFLSAGLLVSGSIIATNAITVPNISTTTGAGYVSTTYLSATVLTAGTFNPQTISTTGSTGQISATNVSASVMTSPYVPKAWGTFTGGGSLTTSVGVASVSRASQGLFNVSLTTTFVSNTAYSVQANLMDSPAGAGAFTARACVVESGTNQTNGFQLKCQSGTSTALDPSLVYFTVLGR